jgi:hypothetical protein
MSTRDIRTYYAHTVCDICGRTLLRGERADIYINGGARRSVCELCKTRALHEGWVREGALAAYPGAGASPARRRTLFGRLRSRRAADSSAPPGAATLDDELEDARWALDLGAGGDGPVPTPPPVRVSERRGGTREPRHVHAVPTSEDHKMASAVEVFNGSEHRRTIAGVARSLGEPAVAVVPDPGHSTLVRIIVSWELCWYRYEIDLADEAPPVRLDGQGYELDELTAREREADAAADDAGQLRLR